MNKLRAALLFALLGTLPVFSQAPDRAHVVLVTIDGFPARMFADPKTSVPRLRGLAKAGVAAERLKVSNPTVTWPNHTTLVTGVSGAKHSVLYNGRLVREGAGRPVRIEPKCDKSELVAVPTIYDLFHLAGLRTAAINWPCTRNADSLDDNFPDVPDMIKHTTPALRQRLVANGILPDETDASFRVMTGPGRDEVWTEAACQVIREHKPAFLLLHLLNTDGTHHRYGPESPASHTALALADAYVGRVLDALDTAGIRQATTVFVVSDHGFAVATNVLQPNVLLRQAGLLELGASNQVAKAKVQVVPEGGMGMLYFTDASTPLADRKAVIDLFRTRKEIADVIEPDRFDSFGFPRPDRNPGMADLVLIPQLGSAVSGSAVGDEFVLPVTGAISQGYHGYLAEDPRMDALFVASGRGIKQGEKVGGVDNLDIAPTIAHLLGQRLAKADGKVLREILSP